MRTALTIAVCVTTALVAAIAVLSFNSAFAELMVEWSAGSGYIRDHAVRTYEGLLLMVMFHLLASILVYFRAPGIFDASMARKVKLAACANILVCAGTVMYAAVFAWKIPTAYL